MHDVFFPAGIGRGYNKGKEIPLFRLTGFRNVDKKAGMEIPAVFKALISSSWQGGIRTPEDRSLRVYSADPLTAWVTYQNVISPIDLCFISPGVAHHAGEVLCRPLKGLPTTYAAKVS